MRADNYSDQTKFFDPKTWIYPVHLIGAGGINNLVGPALAKMGVREIHIWDDDVLEARNCPTEIAYSYSMVGQPKTAAMAYAIEYLMGKDIVNVVLHQERVTEDTTLEGVVVSGVDSMKSRKEIWKAVQASFINIPLYIDGRSAGKHTAIFALSPADFDATTKYETWLFDDSKAMPLECGARNFPPVSLYTASEITRIIAQFHCAMIRCNFILSVSYNNYATTKKEDFRMSNENTNAQVNEEQKQVVMIADGAGTEPIEVQWAEGMTVTTALAAAEIELEEGETAVIGETMIENPDETPVEPGQMIVIDSMPANG